MNTGLTLAGVAISLAVLYANIRPWWKGGRDPKALVPFGGAFGMGALATACAGGLLGWVATLARRGANVGGEKGVKGATGQTPGESVTHGTMGALTPSGAVVVFLLLVAAVMAWKAAGKADKRRMFGGLFCGACLAATAGVAGALAWLVPGVNQAGQVLATAVNGAGIL